MLPTFRDWLLAEARRPLVEPAVLAGYEHAFKDELRRLLGRISDPTLRQKLVAMLDCPIRDQRGQCRSFTDYIIAALIKHGIHKRYDIEQALAYVVEKMT